MEPPERDLYKQISSDGDVYKRQPLDYDEMLAVLPKDHPYASKESYPLINCETDSFIMPALGRDDDVVSLFERNGIKLNIHFDSISLKQRNQMCIRDRDLQMGLSTVSQNLNELENDGLISRNGYFESTGGRKAQIIKIVEDFRISIGLGILKDMFHIVAVNLYGLSLIHIYMKATRFRHSSLTTE